MIWWYIYSVVLLLFPVQIAACELLHAMVLFVLGRSAQPAMQKKVHNVH